MTQAKPILTLKRRPAKRKGSPPLMKGKVPYVVKDKGSEQRKGKRPEPAARQAPKQAPPPVRQTTDEEFLAELQKIAPDLWSPEEPVPLAIGIHKQLYPIAERMQVSRRGLRRFLARWTSSKPYQSAMVEPGAQRRNLDGSAAGDVSEEHGDRARQRIAPD